MSWLDSDASNKRPAVTLFNGSLALIHLASRHDSLIVGGVDVWGTDRVKIIVGLARHEQVVL